ncbi:hypothetical protein [Phaeobacter sp. 11ANDIMAR09]|nr:hypothetical protein [Phaeobacter sp. 11ANDIMAR09]
MQFFFAFSNNTAYTPASASAPQQIRGGLLHGPVLDDIPACAITLTF